jgi:hypothetical protein
MNMVKPTPFDNPFEGEPIVKESAVLACDEPCEIGWVVNAGNIRYVVTSEISREEFEQRNAVNTSHRKGVAGTVTVDGSKALKETLKHGNEPAFDAQYFYACEVSYAR